MAMNLIASATDSLLSIDDVDPGWAEASMRRVNRKDALLIRTAEGSTTISVFAQNRFCTASVQVYHKHLASGKSVRAIVVNTGNTNVGTDASGFAHIRQTCDAVIKLLSMSSEQVLLLSTGVILEPLPVDRIVAGLPAAETNAKPDN